MMLQTILSLISLEHIPAKQPLETGTNKDYRRCYYNEIRFGETTIHVYVSMLMNFK